MSDQSRELPEQPNLRFLKLEAKRRLAAGEFATLHEAQLAVAREHGLSSWAVLKETVTADRPAPSPALARVRWLISRFRDADSVTWVRPAAEEVREHFTERFQSQIPPDTVIDTLIGAAAMFREDLAVLDETVAGLRVQVGELRLEAATEDDPRHRLAMFAIFRPGQHFTDDRVAEPPVVTTGQVPERAMALARESLAEIGLPGLVMAGAETTAVGIAAAGGPAWSLALGWASLDVPEPLGIGHRFPVYLITALITATAALRLVADGLVELDAPANRYLHTVRLADAEVTVRELLTHTGGVDSPENLFGGASADLISLTGPVVACSGPRGAYQHSIGGWGVLGQLVADVTGSRYQDAAESLVLRPLGMTESFFPVSWPERDAVTGYQLDDAGRFEPASGQVCVITAAGGLWATAADLARFGAAWGSLLPADLAAEALRPQAPRGDSGAHIGLGWLVHPGKNLAGIAGGGPGAGTSLLVVPSSGQVSVAMTSRYVRMEPVNIRLLRPVA